MCVCAMIAVALTMANGGDERKVFIDGLLCSICLIWRNTCFLYSIIVK